MSTNAIEFAALRQEGEMRAWLADNGCPEHLANRLIERRMKTPGFRPAQQAQPVADTTIRDKVLAAAIL